MKKIKLPLIVSIAVIVIAIVLGTAIYLFQNQTKSITSFFNNNTNKITRINITNSSGNVITVDDKKLISNISDYLSKLKFKKLYNQPSTGWLYQFSFHENSTNAFVFTFLSYDSCQINSSKYKIENSTDITIDSIYKEAT